MADNAEDDDWFFDSVTRYKQLYMYNLQYPVTALDWINTNCVCVATRGRPTHHELSELSLPEKLCTSEDLALSKNRDFQVLSGGFSSSEICDIKHIPGTRLICSSSKKGEGHVDVLKLGSLHTDLIEVDRKLKNKKPKGSWSLIAVQDQNHVIFGSHGDNLCCGDVMTTDVLQDTCECSMTDKISSMRNVHPHTVCCCLTDGKILNWDKRENTPNVFDTGCDHSVQWTMDLLGNDMIQLSSRGHVQWIDMRKPNQAIYLNNTGLSTNDAQFLRIHLKRQNGSPDQYSISGFDGNVYLYSRQSQTPLFVHEGHARNSSGDPSEVKVVTHLHHPMECVILSAATDGSIHAWRQT
ncbi:WD repeat-containing protein 73-like [Ostrea edulis]|uniref:WD repeat-containing protein 73-like n=1 Tax=Ostrea edulis TaxID=37623 RepID=UPI0020953F81|nr:WD repeat-containing protein 73-like [Ostrea edulis]